MFGHDLITPNLHPRPYYPSEVVRIVNSKQFKLYIANGIYPIDIYTGMDRKTGKTILVMIFLKEETKEAYELWCKYELEEDTI
jgi:hypothetical protein